MPGATSSWKVKDGEMYHLETARESSPNLGVVRAEAILKVKDWAKTTKHDFIADALATSGLIAEPGLTSEEEPEIRTQGKKVLDM